MKTAKIVIATFLAVVALVSGCADTGFRPVPYFGTDHGVVDAIGTVRGL